MNEQRALESQLELYRSASQGGAFTMKIAEGYPLEYGNDIYYKVIGYTQETLKSKLGNRTGEIVNVEDLQAFGKSLDNAIKNGRLKVEREVRITTEDEEERWVQLMGILENREGTYYLDGFLLDVTEKHELLEQVRKNEELYRVALIGSGINIWECDVKVGTLKRAHSSGDIDFLPPVIYDIPYSLIELGMIDERSKGALIELYEGMKNGVPRAVVDLKINAPHDKSRKWERVTAITILDKNGEVIRGIAITEDMTEQKEAEINYQNELQLRDTTSLGFIAGSRANLNKNCVEYVKKTSESVDGLTEIITYDEMMNIGAATMVNADDKERYFKSLDRESLLTAFKQGRHTVSIEYRRKSNEGKISWVRASARLMKDAISGDIYSYSSIRDISEQKSIELSLQQRVEIDEITGAYNKESALSMIQDAISVAQSNNEEYGIAIFKIDGFNDLLSSSGSKLVDNIMIELYAILQSDLTESKIIGRLFVDEMIVWFGGNIDIEKITREVELIISADCISAVMPKTKTALTISVGIAFNNNKKISQEVLLKLAQNALRTSSEHGGNCCTVSEEEGEDEKYIKQIAKNNIRDLVVADLIMRCNSTINTGVRFETVAKTVLRDLCDYYDADYACLIEMDEKSKDIKKTYNCRKRPIIYGVKCAPEDAEALVIDILSDRHKVIIDNLNEIDDNELVDLLKHHGVKSFYGIQLKSDRSIVGYIGLANREANPENLELLEAIGCILANDIKYRHTNEKKKYLQRYDEFTGLLNRKSYLEFAEEFSPDATISMGIVCADINGLKQVNATYGNFSGDRLIYFVAESLTASLTGGKIFRLSGDEFMAVCENITVGALQNMVEDLKQRINNTYYGRVSIGYVWSDMDLNIDNLAYLADEKMMVSKHNYYKEEDITVKHHDSASRKSLIKEISEGRYEMFLQPKATIANSRICGAEALVRYRGDQGELVSPDRFVPMLEQNGYIYYIDLFMFEEVCKIMKRWNEKELQLMPISLNFSRTTLLTENLITRMKEIHDKYDVPKELIEIEVTESIGSVERQTIIEISAQIVGEGYKIALDDFGAKYSNLSIMSAMPLHTLKLDKSLINDIFSNPKTQIVVRNFILTCRDLGIASLTEGVETKEQLEVLKKMECDYAQGYYFNKPIHWRDFERLYVTYKKTS